MHQLNVPTFCGCGGILFIFSLQIMTDLCGTYVEEIRYYAILYLTEVLLVSSGKNNVHCIRHDVDWSLVFLPVFNVGWLWTKCSCWFDILDMNVGKDIFVIFSQEVLSSTLFIIWLFAVASVRSMECMSLVNLKLLGCWRYRDSLKISPAVFAFSTSNDPIGTHPTPFTKLWYSLLYWFWGRKSKETVFCHSAAQLAIVRANRYINVKIWILTILIGSNQTQYIHHWRWTACYVLVAGSWHQAGQCSGRFSACIQS